MIAICVGDVTNIIDAIHVVASMTCHIDVHVAIITTAIHCRCMIVNAIAAIRV